MDAIVPQPSPPEEPILEMNDIQGLAIPGFFKPHMTLLGLRYPGGPELARLKPLLAQLAASISTAQQTLANRRAYRAAREASQVRHPAAAPRIVLTAIGFSASGLAKLTPGAQDIPSEAYQQGLLARAELLGDPTDPTAEGNPKNWVVGASGKALDALVVVAGDARAEVDRRAAELRGKLRASGVEIAYEENGDVRPDLPGHEHFGFDDGISQPGLRGRASAAPGDYVEDRAIDPRQTPEAWLWGLPGQDLVWPGEFVLGYPATSPDPLFAGPPSATTPQWTRNGSFLVFRRLRQDVALFRRTLRQESERLRKLPGFDAFTPEYLAARLVGRWPSGAPVNRVPRTDDANLGEERRANNNFRFDADSAAFALKGGFKDPFPMAKADPAGITCPWAAHIRKVNVRDSGSDLGGRDSTYARRLLRTGIPFGKPLADPAAAGEDSEKGNRGLLFLSIQASIEAQFEFLLARWMGDPTRPKTPGGHDVFIGQNGEPGAGRERRCLLFGDGLQQAELATRAEWVIPTGGGYFFLPSIRALREVLAQ
ncbi:MAG TPA: Dyp-type peroxidase [Thermoanaerobaculia bacterium]|nr:Dyp-type peroxidase [Thermoanaerobaculia bacterium]